MPQRLRTPEEVQQYLARVLATDRRFQIIECRYGWVCRPVLSPEEVSLGRGMGLGNYAVNSNTGVVTAHRGLPPVLIGKEYDEAIRDGREVPGYQVYPPL
ncbi:hypothetical protein [Nocardia brevicatena]|uniref:hypothetical protein n=1 Tax=Nocardia brevicatena TaxID=37327 RepID=UPI0002E373C0|nr:hypothetical protein [Nocardia brevicatena]